MVALGLELRLILAVAPAGAAAWLICWAITARWTSQLALALGDVVSAAANGENTFSEAIETAPATSAASNQPASKAGRDGRQPVCAEKWSELIRSERNAGASQNGPPGNVLLGNKHN